MMNLFKHQLISFRPYYNTVVGWYGKPINRENCPTGNMFFKDQSLLKICYIIVLISTRGFSLLFQVLC